MSQSILSSLALGLTAGLLATPALAAAPRGIDVYETTTTDDTVDVNPGDGICADANGDCSLRAAVQEANATGNTTEIRLGPLNAYALTLTGAGEDACATGDLDVTGQIQINGNESTLDGLGADRFFDVLPGARLSVNRLYASNGGVVNESGAGYRNNGSQLALLFCIVEQSSATGPGASGGAVFNDGGSLFIVSSLFEANQATRAGGAIESLGGSTTILRAFFIDNVAGPGPGNGGGFHLTGAGTVGMRRTLFNGNSAASEGGAIWNSADGDMNLLLCRILGNSADGLAADNGGGGVFNDGGTLVMNGGNVFGNSAVMGSGSGGGLLNNGGDVTLNTVTFRGNTSNRAGGGVECVVGTTLLNDCTVDSNATGAAPGNGGGLHVTGAGTVDVNGGTVTSNVAASEGGGLWNGAGTMTVVGTLFLDNAANGTAADEGGGGLFNEGGQLDVSGVTLSGNTAIQGAGSGGAIFNNGGTLSLADSEVAGNMSNRAGGGIELVAGTSTLMNVLLNGNMTGAAPGNGGGLHLTGMGNVAVADSEVTGNSAASEGGGLWNSATGTMLVMGCTIDSNTASGIDPDQGGGGLFNDGGAMTVDDTLVANNVADGAAGSGGGALNNTGGTLDITDSTFVANSSQRAGGGIEANAGDVTMDQVALALNVTGPAPGNGGGLHLSGLATIGFDRSVAIRNTATSEGGGLWNSAAGTMSLFDSLVDGNTASGAAANNGGGGLFNDGGDLVIQESTISNNIADGAAGSGGGILNMNGDLLAQVCTISGNSSSRAGGGVEATGLDAAGMPAPSTSSFLGVTLSDNSTGAAPGNGGAFHQTGPGLTGFDNCFVTGNTAAAEGGGLWNSSGASMQILDSLIDGNTASGADPDQGGGGVFTDGGPTLISGSTLSGNMADGASGSGGGVLNNLGDLDIVNCSISGNSSMRAGGGVEANVGDTNLSDVVLSGNSTGAAPGNGGGLHLTGAGLVVYDEGLCSVNDAANEGGGLWNSATGTMTVTNVSIQGNTAPVGTDVFNDGGDFTIDGNTVPPGP